MTTSAPPTNQLATRIAAVAVTLMFGVNGTVIGGYGGSLPSLRDKLGIDATHIAIMLFCAGAAAILAMQVGGRLADALGAREITLAAIPLLIVGMITIGLAPSFAIAIIGVVLIGLGNGAMDVAMNAIGVQVEASRQRPIMSFFHAFWSIGTFIGAGAVLLLATVLGLHGAAIVTTVSILIAVVTLIALGILLKITPEAAVVHHTVDGVKTPIPKVIWILGVMALAFGLSEGTATDWSSLHVTDGRRCRPHHRRAGADYGQRLHGHHPVAGRPAGDPLRQARGRALRRTLCCPRLSHGHTGKQPANAGARLGIGRFRGGNDCTTGVRRGRAYWWRDECSRWW
jgi:hypothetical protein